METVGRLDLRDPTNRAMAEPLLTQRMPWPPALAADLRAVLLYTARAGVVERSVYAVDDRSHAWSGGLELGVALGSTSPSSTSTAGSSTPARRDAGSPERRRAD